MTTAPNLGVLEIAEFLGVKDRTVHQWRRRGVLPAPDGPRTNGAMTWKRATILEWAGQTGRLHTEDLQEQYQRRFKRKPVPPRRGGALPVKV